MKTYQYNQEKQEQYNKSSEPQELLLVLKQFEKLQREQSRSYLIEVLFADDDNSVTSYFSYLKDNSDKYNIKEFIDFMSKNNVRIYNEFVDHLIMNAE